MDPSFSADHARFMETHPDVLSEGWATVEPSDNAGGEWVCDECFADFQAQFRWRVIGSGPRRAARAGS
jgi:hypothetical protein